MVGLAVGTKVQGFALNFGFWMLILHNKTKVRLLVKRTKLQDSTVPIEEFHKEIDNIQACISRMAKNSFMIKRWAFMLVVAFIAITTESMNLYVICAIGIFILLVCWCLDAFFLKMEKLYRFKYEWTITERPRGNKEYLYDLNPYQTKTWIVGRKEPSIIAVMFSKPCILFMFYGSPIFIGVVVIILNAKNCWG